MLLRRLGIAFVVLLVTSAAFGGCPPLIPANVLIAFSDDSATCSDSQPVCHIGRPVTFTAAAFGYQFACATHLFTWNFGDGSPDDFRGQTVTHTFTQYGNFDVSLKIQTPGNTVIVHQRVGIPIIDVVLPPPTLSVERLSAFTFAFTASSSTPIETVAWNFGDGSAPYSVPWRTTNTMVHQYAPDASGIYEVTLTATFPSGEVTNTRAVVAISSRQRAARH